MGTVVRFFFVLKQVLDRSSPRYEGSAFILFTRLHEAYTPGGNEQHRLLPSHLQLYRVRPALPKGRA